MLDDEIFAEAVELPEDRRAEFLKGVFLGRPEAQAKMEAMLAAHRQADSLLDIEPPASTEVHSANVPKLLEQIGNFKLLQKIGEGGFGAVYMAEQLRPVKRKVALKVIKPGMDSDAVVARFEAERQALAMMDHTHIAKVFDGGVTEQGRPYFVMELVKGVPITTYCDDNNLRTTERLQLFIDVCKAVQHAHHKGIIHRDIKPSNVMVTLHDGQPVVKVIDFGVAKAMHSELTEKTLFTAYGQMIGTPQYMSPEQAEMSGLDVDTRSDVYSLGVLLYELLTGTTPLEAETLRAAGYVGMQKMIKENEPPKPSARISSSGDRLTHIAQHRSVSPERLHKEVRGDLDWIVMKALEKDRVRRYDAPSRLAEDLNNYLKGEAVKARPPTIVYRMQKACQRNRVFFSTAGAVFFALSLGLLGMWSENSQKSVALQKVSQQNSELSATLAERDRALAQWHQAVIKRGIEAALRGDVWHAEEIAMESREASAPREWTDMILGLAQMNAGNMNAAVSYLRDAYNKNPNNLAIASALSMALIGNNGAFLTSEPTHESPLNTSSGHLTAALQKIEPSSEFHDIDLLFRAWTLLYEDPTLSVVSLRELNAQERPWSVAQAMLAMALVHEASDTGKPEYALEALETIRSCEAELADSPFTMFVGLDCRCVALLFASDRLSDKERHDIFAEAERITEKMEEYPNGWAADFRAAFHELCNSPSTAQVYKRTRNDWWRANRAGVLLRLDPEWLINNIQSTNDPMPISAIANASALAILGAENMQQSLARYRALSDLPIWAVKVGSLEILLLLGELDECQKRSQELLDEARNSKDFFDVPFWVFEKRLRYLSREPGFDASTLVASMEGSRFGECYANYLIGLTLRAEGETNEARNYFGACVATKQFWMSQYQFSKSILQIEYGVELQPEIQP